VSGATAPVRVLLVEDDEDDYVITRDMLERHGRVRFVIEWTPSYNDAMAAIQSERHDVYLIDYRLGERTGLELVREAFAARRFAPVIMLTGQATYEIDLEATALGVTDYLVKQELDSPGLERAIRYAISHAKIVSDLSRSEERYTLAVRAANDGIWDWDLASDLIYFSPRWHAILGQLEQDGEEDPSAWFDLVHPSDLPRLRSAIDGHLSGDGEHLQSEHRMLHADGSWRWLRTRGVAIRGIDGTPTRMAGSLSDFTDQRIAQLRLEHDALHDTLTDLPNRCLFIDRVEHLLRHTDRDPGRGCAILFLDIDGFKLVNDSLSHAVGDHLLMALAERFSSVLRPGDTVARLGGDEFTVLLDDVAEVGVALVVADRVLHSLDEAFNIDGNELSMSVSIGVALSTLEVGAADLMRYADIAMYDAKRHGRACCSVFDDTMRRSVVQRMTRETELRHAVDGSLLGVHYQPIVELATGRIAGLEALARWPEGWHPVTPTEFISVAEEIGVIGALGHQVMRAALGTLADWRRDGLVDDDVCMSVNVSGRQLDDDGLAERVLTAVDSFHLPANSLKLEITESTLMQEIKRAQQTFTTICAEGIGLHLDDFGTGYSSLSALRQLPVDTLKIDRSFIVTGSGQDEDKEVIVRSTVALAHSLGLSVIAEGIEDADQLERLKSLGCDFGQGYLFSRPLSTPDARRLLEFWSPREIAEVAGA
jgi:diguanylate cyclase (GGDEF)-like protein/PAS domain S-box-containing protein